MLEIIDSFNSVAVGIMAGSLPTLSMMFCSLLAVNVQFTSTFEASAQNYCAGITLNWNVFYLCVIFTLSVLLI